jgi:hypothetical protein
MTLHVRHILEVVSNLNKKLMPQRFNTGTGKAARQSRSDALRLSSAQTGQEIHHGLGMTVRRATAREEGVTWVEES